MNVRSLICEIICLLDFLMDVSSSKRDAAMHLRNVKWIANWIPFFFFFLYYILLCQLWADNGH